MTRSANPKEYARRRDAFLDAAQRLIETKGYEAMSIDDVLREVGVTKGAFYHYFDSKAALLEGVVERLGDAALAQAKPALADPGLTAVERFEAFVAGVAAYEFERRELITGYLQAWLSEANAAVREKLRMVQVARLEPVLERIVRQGIEEGDFAVGSPEDTARVLVSLWQGMGDDTTGLMFALLQGSVTHERFEQRVGAYLEAMERILGARPGSLRFPAIVQARDWQRSATTSGARVGGGLDG